VEAGEGTSGKAVDEVCDGCPFLEDERKKRVGIVGRGGGKGSCQRGGSTRKSSPCYASLAGGWHLHIRGESGEPPPNGTNWATWGGGLPNKVGQGKPRCQKERRKEH